MARAHRSRKPDDPTLYGIHRMTSGAPGDGILAWRVQLSRRRQHYLKTFVDALYGGADGALAAAKVWRDEALAMAELPYTKREYAQQLRASNTSGYPGVRRVENMTEPRRGPYWMAWVNLPNGLTKRKVFTVKAWGEEQAKTLAIAAREKLLDYLEGDMTPPEALAYEAASVARAPLAAADADTLASTPMVTPIAIKVPATRPGNSPPAGIIQLEKRGGNSTSLDSLSRPFTPSTSFLKGASMARTLTALTPLGDALMFSSLRGREEMSRLFEFQLELLAETNSIDPAAVLGKSMGVKIDLIGGATRYLDGHCMRFGYAGRHGRYHRYSATVRPALWYATRGSDMKIFQGKNVPDIIKEVLGKYPVLIEDKLTASYRVWDYCVQYRETDFNFVCRLMEHEGVYTYFKHSEGTHTLVLCDGIGAHAPFPGYASVPFYGPDAAHSDDEKDHFDQWLSSQAVDPGIYVTDEYDFKKPKADLSLNEPKVREHSNASYEIFDFPGGYTELGDGRRYTRVRMEELQHLHKSVNGAGHVRGAAPGYLLSLTNHKRGDQNQQYLVTAVDYALSDNQYEADGSGSYDVRVGMTATPSSEPYRPKRLTPKPHTTGPESAKVVGPKGEEIYTDKYGRVKVQFHWDRYGKEDENSSCWIRVSNGWAGSGFGSVYIPRIDQEVLVDFIGGDPDRPIVTSRLYNEDNMPAWELPKHKTQSGTQTRWSKGGGGKHMLRFEDQKGIEHIELSTDHGNTHLHMGYLMNQGTEAKRSYGFEMRTNEWGSIRADKGLLLTTYTQEFAKKISHDSPDGHEQMGAALAASSSVMQEAKQGMDAAKGAVTAMSDGRGEMLSGLVAAVGGAAATGGGGGAKEFAVPSNPDPGMPDSQRMLGLSQKIDKPIVSIVSPEGQTMISPQPIVINSGQSVSVHATTSLTLNSNQQVTTSAGTGMLTTVNSGGQLNNVTGGDIVSMAHAGAMNLVSKADMSLTSFDGNANVYGQKNVVINAVTENVFIHAKTNIKLICGASMIEMKADGTIIMAGKQGAISFEKVLQIFGMPVDINSDKG
jgi:type VI secretion system secreted protein VgrG